MGSVKPIPSQKWLSNFVFIVGLVYHIVGAILVRKHMKVEEKKYFLKQNIISFPYVLRIEKSKNISFFTLNLVLYNKST